MKTIIKTGIVAPFILAIGMANAALITDFGDVAKTGFASVQSINQPIASFDDHFLFSLSTPTYIDGLLGNLLQTVNTSGGPIDTVRIDNMGVDFAVWDGMAWNNLQSWSVAAGTQLVYHNVLGAGSYRIDLFGDVTGSIGGTYDLAAVTYIPEPSTYALMLGGLGLVGFMARRRKANVAVSSNLAV